MQIARFFKSKTDAVEWKTLDDAAKYLERLRGDASINIANRITAFTSVKKAFEVGDADMLGSYSGRAFSDFIADTGYSAPTVYADVIIGAHSTLVLLITEGMGRNTALVIAKAIDDGRATMKEALEWIDERKDERVKEAKSRGLRGRASSCWPTKADAIAVFEMPFEDEPDDELVDEIDPDEDEPTADEVEVEVEVAAPDILAGLDLSNPLLAGLTVSKPKAQPKAQPKAKADEGDKPEPTADEVADKVARALAKAKSPGLVMWKTFETLDEVQQKVFLTLLRSWNAAREV